jgi:hypothetical protein
MLKSAERERVSSNQPHQATHLYLKNIHNETIVGMLPSNVFIPLTIFLALISYIEWSLCLIMHAIKTYKSGCTVTYSAFLWQYPTAYGTGYFFLSKINML